MKSSFRALALGLLLLLPAAAHAEAPVITSISDVSLNAGGSMTLTVVAYDLNGDAITLTSSLPAFATLNAPTTGTGIVATTITLFPTSGNTGTYTGTITATAGGETDTEDFQITVNSAGSNLAPTVTAPSLWTVVEGQPISLVVTASDPNGDALTALSASGLPSGATFTTNGTYTSGTLTWTPTTTQAGHYDVTFTASNSLQGSTSTHFVVLESGAGNDCPTITVAATRTVTEGQLLTFDVTASDPDGDDLTLTATGLPSGATFNDHDNNTGTFNWTPTTTQSGVYVVTFTANDNQGCFQIATTTITVNEETGGNECPVLTAPATRTVNEGQLLTFNITVSDPDGGNVDLSASGVPSGADFDDNENNTGTFTWTPGSTQSGTYTVTFTANDNEGCTRTATTVITVNDGTGGNECPVLTAPATRTVNEGQLLTFDVTVSDPDGGNVDLSASGVPSGADFDDNDNNTGTFEWTPSFSQSGTYTVTFTANDNEGCTDTATTTITVNNVSGGTPEATGTFVGKFRTKKKFVCFRIMPVNDSFDLRDVRMNTIVLAFNGDEVEALPRKTHLEYECDDDDGDHDGDDCDECDDDDDDDGDDDEECDRDDDDDDVDCSVSHLRACFAMSDLRELFGEADFMDRIPSATIRGQLTTGETFVATLNGGKFASEDHKRKENKRKMHARVSPNPLNPKGELSFTLAQSGRVRVGVYDVQGRLVKTLLDENRAAGSHTVLWDGTSTNGKVSSGVYFFRVDAVEGSEVVRVTVLK